jgi:transcriptional regulator with XRE-family HTH domain
MFYPSQVRAEIARRSLTLSEFSEQSGVPVSTISKALSDDGNPTTETLDKMAKALGVSEAVFFTRPLHLGVNEHHPLDQAV